MVFCDAVVIGSGIFQFTRAQVYVFVLTAFVYQYVKLAFTSLLRRNPIEDGAISDICGQKSVPE